MRTAIGAIAGGIVGGPAGALVGAAGVKMLEKDSDSKKE